MELRNGIDVEELRKTVQVIEANPSAAKSCFRVTNRWLDGGHNQAKVGSYYVAGFDRDHDRPIRIDADEPRELLGHDEGANPVEYLLAALSSCMTTTIIYHAAAKGIEIESLRSEFSGDLDLRGFLNLSESVPKGYQQIEATFKVKMEGDLEEISDLYCFSPVYSMVSATVPIEVKFVRDGS
jgi:uncharacterized OsmC-like protein